jgi:hypothetical protein
MIFVFTAELCAAADCAPIVVGQIPSNTALHAKHITIRCVRTTVISVLGLMKENITEAQRQLPFKYVQ